MDFSGHLCLMAVRKASEALQQGASQKKGNYEWENMKLNIFCSHGIYFNVGYFCHTLFHKEHERWLTDAHNAKQWR